MYIFTEKFSVLLKNSFGLSFKKLDFLLIRKMLQFFLARRETSPWGVDAPNTVLWEANGTSKIMAAAFNVLTRAIEAQVDVATSILFWPRLQCNPVFQCMWFAMERAIVCHRMQLDQSLILLLFKIYTFRKYQLFLINF